MEERYKVLLYNAIVLIEEEMFHEDYGKEDLLINLGMTEDEYKEVMEEI